jgi:hypothetical protein
MVSGILMVFMVMGLADILLTIQKMIKYGELALNAILIIPLLKWCVGIGSIIAINANLYWKVGFVTFVGNIISAYLE